jgi:hypothetical protein
MIAIELYLFFLLALNINSIRTENDVNKSENSTQTALDDTKNTTVNSIIIQNNTSSNNVITSQFNPILRMPTSSTPVSTTSSISSVKYIKKTSTNETDSDSDHSGRVKAVLASILLDSGSNGNQANIPRVNLLNRCWLQPCMNNATCYGSVNSYHCFCQSGYVGINCEIKLEFNVTKRKIKKCHDSYCNQKGDCFVNYDAKKYCKCMDGYFGINCEMHYYKNTMAVKKFIKLTSPPTSKSTITRSNNENKQNLSTNNASSTTTANDKFLTSYTSITKSIAP